MATISYNITNMKNGLNTGFKSLIKSLIFIYLPPEAYNLMYTSDTYPTEKSPFQNTSPALREYLYSRRSATAG